MDRKKITVPTSSNNILQNNQSQENSRKTKQIRKYPDNIENFPSKRRFNDDSNG